MYNMRMKHFLQKIFTWNNPKPRSEHFIRLYSELKELVLKRKILRNQLKNQVTLSGNINLLTNIHTFNHKVRTFNETYPHNDLHFLKISDFPKNPNPQQIDNLSKEQAELVFILGEWIDFDLKNTKNL